MARRQRAGADLLPGGVLRGAHPDAVTAGVAGPGALVRSVGMAAISEMVPPRWFTPDFIARQPAAVAFVMDMLHGTDPAGYAGCGEAIAGMDLRPRSVRSRRPRWSSREPRTWPRRRGRAQ